MISRATELTIDGAEWLPLSLMANRKAVRYQLLLDYCHMAWIPYVRVGNRIYVQEHKVDECLEKRKNKIKPAALVAKRVSEKEKEIADQLFNSEHYMTVRQVCLATGLTAAIVRNCYARGGIPHMKIGGTVYIKGSDAKTGLPRRFKAGTTCN